MTVAELIGQLIGAIARGDVDPNETVTMYGPAYADEIAFVSCETDADEPFFALVANTSGS